MTTNICDDSTDHKHVPFCYRPFYNANIYGLNLLQILLSCHQTCCPHHMHLWKWSISYRFTYERITNQIIGNDTMVDANTCLFLFINIFIIKMIDHFNDLHNMHQKIILKHIAKTKFCYCKTLSTFLVDGQVQINCL